MRAEILAALSNAGPRVVTGLEADRLKARATVDPLTSLLNRRGLDGALNRMDVRDGAMVYADLDRFKTLNDKLGHPAGDAALMHFARIIREQIRSGDAAARIGGEEFAVWLPGTGLDLGARIAERIRLKLGTTPWDWRGQAWPLSASFGVAACPETAASVGELPGRRRTPRCTWPRTVAGTGWSGPADGSWYTPHPYLWARSLLIFLNPGATGFDGYEEEIAACPGPESW